ncbi:MAG TPA: N-acetylmuramic acid 6-phosphate etherase [Beutenbergiaceae bacterium]|nr:N-acetylmuramic acid 6-phosphate etherase [Beutenbergiaceae bacterium]
MTNETPTPDRTDGLATEQIDPRFRDLDLAPTLQVLSTMNEAERAVPEAVAAVLPAIAAVVDATALRLRDGGRLFYIGAGTSGRLGVLDAAECPPTFHTDPGMVQGIIAGGREAMFLAVEGVEDSAAAGAADIEAAEVGPGDVVVGIAASGRTPYVLGAADAAARLGALTVGLACNTGSELGRRVVHALEVEVGPEVLAGSTRLKAGSATKQVLNMISTGVMIRLGKTYQNLMVDLSVTNAKLRDRAERLVMAITGTTRDIAARALEDAGLRVPVAVLMVHHRADRDYAERALERAGGVLRQALQVK